MNNSKAETIDMSSKGIDKRLREVAQLYHLGTMLKSAKRIGKVKDVSRKKQNGVRLGK